MNLQKLTSLFIATTLIISFAGCTSDLKTAQQEYIFSDDGVVVGGGTSTSVPTTTQAASLFSTPIARDGILAGGSGGASGVGLVIGGN